MLLSINYGSKEKYLLFILAYAPLLIVNKDILNPLDLLVLVFLSYCNKIPLRTIAKYAFLISVVELVTHYILVFSGIMTERVLFSPAKGYTYDLGFGNPNSLGVRSVHVSVSLFILLWGKIRNNINYCTLYLLVVLLLNEYIYRRSGSRAPYYANFILVVFFLLQRLKLIPRFSRFIIGLLPIMFFGVTVYLTTHSAIYSDINDLSSNRLGIYHAIIGRMHLYNYLFGIAIPEGSAMDSSYLMLFFDGGISLIILFSYNAYKTIVNKYDEIKHLLPIILAMLSVAIAENTLSTASGVSIIFWTIIMYYSFSRYNPEELKI
jgi:hypothetical protein